MPGTMPSTVSAILRDALAGLERDGRGGAGAPPPACSALREAAPRAPSRSTRRAPRRSAPRGSSCRRARPRSAPPRDAERRRRRRSSSSRSCRSPRSRLPLPGDLCRRSVATTPSPPREARSPRTFSSSSTSRSARIETSSWSSVGSRVVSRCSHSPGASSVIRHRLSWCLPAKRISSYASPAITGSSRIRVAISQYQAGRPKNAKTKTAITITQSRNAVPQRGWMSEYRCAISGSSSLAGLVGVDRLVLGGVVLEDAAQVGQAARSARGSATKIETRISALDDHEPARRCGSAAGR